MEATLYSQMEDRKVVDPTLKVALSDAQQLQDSIAEGSEKYYVLPMAKFPKTIPPEEDIMYFELFNFFHFHSPIFI